MNLLDSTEGGFFIRRREGSITLFLSLTLVLLLALLAGIVDIARWHVAMSQSERTLHLANQAVLSHYDDYMKEAYGIFAFEPAVVRPGAVLRTYLPATPLVDGMKAVSADMGPSLVSGPGLDYYDRGIQSFMKLRAPMLLLGPVLEKLSLLQKSGKTTKLMEAQQEVLEAGTEIDALYEAFRNDVLGRVASFDSKALSSLLGKYQNGAEAWWTLSEKVEDLEESLDSLQDRRSDLRSDLRRVTGDDEAAAAKRASLRSKISSLGRRITSTKEDIADAKAAMAAIKKHYQHTIPLAMEALTGNESVPSLLEANRRALAKLEELDAATAALREDVEGFKEDSEKERAEYIEESYLGVMSRMDEMLMALGAEGQQFSEVGNLPLMKERLERNIGLLEALEEEMETLLSAAQAIGRTSFSGRTDAILKDNRYEVARYHLVQSLEGYSTGFIFKGGEAAGEVDPAVAANVDEGEGGLEAGYDLGDILKGLGLEEMVLPKDRPSVQLGQDGEEEASEKGLLDSLLKGGGLLDFASAGKDKLYRNEYAVGMFTMMHEMATEEEETTLAGFAKSSHPFPGEVEYIITGMDNSVSAVTAFAGMLLATRTALNAASLIASPTKQQYIMSVAQGIAGWWTAGIGAIALAVVINVLWALLEAVVDVMLLLRGNRVPLIKTDSTWYTSLGGSWKSLLSAGLAEGKALLVDKGADAVKTFVSEGVDRAKAEAASLRLKIESALDRTYAGLMGVADGLPSASDYFEEGTPEHALAEAVMEEAKGAFAGSVPTYEELAGHRKELLDDYESRIRKAMDGIEEKVEKQVDSIVSDLKDDFDLETAKKKLDGLDKPASGKQAGHSASDFMPRFDYKDYCRAMLFFGVDENKALARMMDLMEVNLRKQAGREALNLSGYAFSIQSEAAPVFAPLFPVLPFESRVFTGLTRGKAVAEDAY